ncbi:hypothetical protein DEIPH_ctg045orf0003 [Deinococcus phoenicis]|uniref:Uncharacterized protein n=1 Tax=Deinococcus phoenicis TaxID=1476583 RepID=A0A016QM98_9DEIO|nr:hypothetical protein [Deinococcus phoenicis]EYB67275.1 hypothetical protein DEIPH_ctg045orf0003 [Deinococcus phoenicis]
MTGAAALRLLAAWVKAQADYAALTAGNAPDDERGEAALRFLEVDAQLRALNSKDVTRWATEQAQAEMEAGAPSRRPSEPATHYPHCREGLRLQAQAGGEGC